MHEVDPEETRTQEVTWLNERIATLEKEKAAMEMALQAVEMKVALQEGFIKELVQRCGLME